LAKSGIKQFLSEIFAWWGGQTWGTRLWIWRFGDYVGSDEFGNKYYQDRKADRRYVTYGGSADASTIPPGWHGWIHFRTDLPPTRDGYAAHAWEQPRVTGDYDAWSPQ
jgi:NADH:ubiquinone oxidoreductase subunit